MKRKRIKRGESPVFRDSEVNIEYHPIGRNGKVKVIARLAGEPIVVDAIEITKAKARREFVVQLYEAHPTIDGDAIDRELLKIAADLPGTTEEATTDLRSLSDAALAGMPGTVVKAAEAMLRAPDLMERVAADIGLLGVAGEEKLGKILYLVAVSRLLEKPLAARVHGPTASGKSHIANQAAPHPSGSRSACEPNVAQVAFLYEAGCVGPPFRCHR